MPITKPEKYRQNLQLITPAGRTCLPSRPSIYHGLFSSRGTVVRMNETFLADLDANKYPHLPASARAGLVNRDAQRADERITLPQARIAGWSETEIAAMNNMAWDAAQIGRRLPALQKRGLEVFYNVGSNDNVAPGLLELGRQTPNFPIYIIPGGQHGGPITIGFTRRVPIQPEVQDNLYAFAQHHFFGARALVAAPKIHSEWDRATPQIQLIVNIPDGTEPEKNELSWSVNRHPSGSLPYEYDSWQTAPLRQTGPATFAGKIAVPSEGRTVDVITTHLHTANGLALAFSSPILRVEAD